MLAASKCNRVRVEAWVGTAVGTFEKPRYASQLATLTSERERRGSERGWAWPPLSFVIRFESFGGF